MLFVAFAQKFVSAKIIDTTVIKLVVAVLLYLRNDVFFKSNTLGAR
jgi:hypothetical protein